MINTWFIGDTHFGHTNILTYEPEARPFKTVEEMNDVMVDRWNSVVNDNDIVYHLGDFAFGRDNIGIAARLHGRKILILGNHDKYPAAEYLKYFDKLFGAFFWKNCILSHIPVHPNNLGSRAFLNIHGHLHSKKVGDFSWVEYEDMPNQEVMTFKEDRNYYNVSCEQNNLTPIHADEIRSRLKEIGSY